MRIRRTRITIRSAVLLELLLATCAPSTGLSGGEPIQQMVLAGTDWDLAEYGGRAPQPDAPITIAFSEAEVTGSTGCNHYFGSYTLEGNKLSLGQIGNTVQLCEGLMEQEQAYLTLLAAADTVALENGHLIISTAQGTLTFRPPAHAVLDGTPWSLAGIAEGEAVVETWLDSQITALFQGSKLTGSAGCNQYSADYRVDGETLTLGAIVQTEMACGEERNQRETAYLEALDRVAGYTIRRDTLTLLDADDDVLLAFRLASPAGE